MRAVVERVVGARIQSESLTVNYELVMTLNDPSLAVTNGGDKVLLLEEILRQTQGVDNVYNID